MHPPKIYVSAARRRARRRIVLVLLAALGLAGYVLAGTWDDERRLPWTDTSATSPREGGPGGRGGPGGLGGSAELGSDDGYVGVGESLSPLSDEPAIAQLDSDLRDALLQAAADASADGIVLRVNGGWRSERYQQHLLDRAVQEYGSVEAARQYVKPPEESSHVTGDAVDVGPSDADSWLSQHGSEYGLCQIYANEPWHFELATEAGGTCPEMTVNAAGG